MHKAGRRTHYNFQWDERKKTPLLCDCLKVYPNRWCSRQSWSNGGTKALNETENHPQGNAHMPALKSVNAHRSTTAFHFWQNSYCCNVHCLSFFILVAPYTNCENELKTVEGAVKYCTIENLLINEATSVSVTISEGSWVYHWDFPFWEWVQQDIDTWSLNCLIAIHIHGTMESMTHVN